MKVTGGSKYCESFDFFSLYYYFFFGGDFGRDFAKNSHFE